MVTVVLVRGEEEHAELRAIQAASVRRMDLWPPDVLGGVSSGCVRRRARTGRSHRPSTADGRSSRLRGRGPPSTCGTARCAHGSPPRRRCRGPWPTGRSRAGHAARPQASGRSTGQGTRPRQAVPHRPRTRPRAPGALSLPTRWWWSSLVLFVTRDQPTCCSHPAFGGTLNGVWWVRSRAPMSPGGAERRKMLT